MSLKGNQVRNLRAKANRLDPVLLIGKNGISDATVKQASDSLEAHELIKCATQNNCPYNTLETGSELAERLEADLVQVIGHRFVLYRKSSRKDFDHIKLE